MQFLLKLIFINKPGQSSDTRKGEISRNNLKSNHMKEETQKKEYTIEDYKKWYHEECNKNLKLEEEIKMLKEVIKVQAIYMANI